MTPPAESCPRTLPVPPPPTPLLGIVGSQSRYLLDLFQSAVKSMKAIPKGYLLGKMKATLFFVGGGLILATADVSHEQFIAMILLEQDNNTILLII